MQTNFPFIVTDTVISRNGNFYIYRSEKSHWYKMELYLPAGEGTYGEPLSATCNRFIEDILSGVRPFKFAITDSGNYDTTNYDKYVQKWVTSSR